MMTKEQAKALASETADQNRGIYATVGSFTTNGEERFVVNVTHDDKDSDHRRTPYTLARG